jgi:hypothetical protein
VLNYPKVIERTRLIPQSKADIDRVRGLPTIQSAADNKIMENTDISNLPAFGTYAAAFEESLLDDDWTRLEQYFSPGATYPPGDGTKASGRDAVIETLKDSVNTLERKCDSRDALGDPEISESEDTITLKFTINYSSKGLPGLILRGHETAQFSNGLILRMGDVIDDPSATSDWMEKL